jgi:acyl-CoA thioesterase-2
VCSEHCVIRFPLHKKLRGDVLGAVLEELLHILVLENIGEDRFIGTSQDLGWGAIYGGQFLAQGLRACQHTVLEDRRAHSIQAYFLKWSFAKYPVEYRVERLRDGRSFSSRRVLAYQEGVLVFSMQIGFQISEGGLEHQLPVSTEKRPDELLSEEDIAKKYPERYPPHFRVRAQRDRAFDVRPLVDANPFHPKVLPPKRSFWCRANGAVPNDPNLHQCLALWMTDGPILSTSLFPHGMSWSTPGLQITSLDHVLWFHRDIDVCQWFYYDLDSPTSGGGRGFGRGSLIQEGRLVGTVMQEGLIRMRDQD